MPSGMTILATNANPNKAHITYFFSDQVLLIGELPPVPPIMLVKCPIGSVEVFKSLRAV